MLLNVIIELS